MYALQLGVETLVYIGFMGFQPYLHGYVHKHKKKIIVCKLLRVLTLI